LAGRDPWQDAIHAVGKLLVDDHAVEERFTLAMIEMAIEFGPYFVIAPGVALPHARPEDGVVRSSIAVITLSKPVEFGNVDNDPVTLVIALAAKDKVEHVQGLSELANILGDEARLEKILACKDDEELLSILLDNNQSDSTD
jgi:mannitol/fructose-specific phosphotransferase system IIA component (Ntr-type)